jgi:predicted kinase
MTILRTTVGLPGAGKTTDAVSWVAIDPDTRARINRDDLREMMHGGYLGRRTQEDQVTAMRDAAILKLLRAGISVVVDDTNLRWKHVYHLERIARRVHVPFEIVSYLDVDLDTCVERDRTRAVRNLGRQRITTMWENALRDMIENWRSSIADDLAAMGHTGVADMIDASIDDPEDLRAAHVVRLALDYTRRRLATYAPRRSDSELTFRGAA